MKPSAALGYKRAAVREATTRFRTANPRVFGSVVHGTDQDGSDLDVLVDALPGATLFDLGGLQAELEDLLADKRTQLAVIMSLVILGEVVTRSWTVPLRLPINIQKFRGEISAVCAIALLTVTSILISRSYGIRCKRRSQICYCTCAVSMKTTDNADFSPEASQQVG
jgi:uncharacterized protein